MIRENWRVAALVLLLVLSAVALFVPGVGLSSGGPQAAQQADAPTNLQFGLDLSGGSRIRAPLVGWTAEGVDLGDQPANETARGLAAELGNATISDIRVRGISETRDRPAIEVTANVSRSTFAAALDAIGVDYEGIRAGVTAETREQTIRVIQSKVNAAGLSGGTVQTVFSTGEQRYYVLLEVPNRNQSTVVDLVNSRGTVEVHAYHSVQRNGSTQWVNRTVLTREDFQQINIAQRSQELGPHVPVSIRPAEAERFQSDMVETGVAADGGTACGWPGDPSFEAPPPRGAGGERGPCLLTVVDGEVVYSAGMSGDLAGSMSSGSWAQNPQFVLQTPNMTEARELSVNLRAGALPAQLDVQSGTVSFVAASLAENFKLFSLITGIVAVIAVAVVVFIRYGDALVGAPMIVTALSEVAILLGFAAMIGLPLDLSHIAGFIAVIGTGVDDLIIIADEVMAEGSVTSDRVFRNRFRKAFWMIGAAAATTIIAMSPLAVLSLGDLQGFAIITILGVLIGVLITRPAYGDILRSLQTER